MSTPLPPLPYDDWAETKTTLHLFCQIVGKVRMAAHPKLNHWWHVTLYPEVRGLGTRAIPYRGGAFELSLDLVAHRFEARTSAGDDFGFALNGLSVAEFYARVTAALTAIGTPVTILPRPYDMGDRPNFQDDRHAVYDAEAVTRFWQALRWSAGVFEQFRGRFLGKQTPVHLYWHSFDLALTRFSGRAAPRRQGTQADREAYSHEVISFGFWPGDAAARHAAYYAYAAPEPDGIAEQPLAPEGAEWTEVSGGHTALLRYDTVRAAADPEAALLAFLDSAYLAGARRAGWEVNALTRADAT